MRRHTTSPLSQAPRVGDTIIVRGHEMRILRVHPAGTVDVQSHDGHCYRVSGLPFLHAEAA